MPKLQYACTATEYDSLVHVLTLCSHTLFLAACNVFHFCTPHALPTCVAVVLCMHCVAVVLCMHCVAVVLCMHCVPVVLCMYCVPVVLCMHCVPFAPCIHVLLCIVLHTLCVFLSPSSDSLRVNTTARESCLPLYWLHSAPTLIHVASQFSVIVLCL